MKQPDAAVHLANAGTVIAGDNILLDSLLMPLVASFLWPKKLLSSLLRLFKYKLKCVVLFLALLHKGAEF